MPYVAIPASGSSVALTSLTGLTDKQVVFGSSAGLGTSSADVTYDDTTNDFAVSASESGGSVGISLANTSNTASSSCAITATVAGGTADDATFRAVVSGVTTWSWGVDNSDTDNWKLAPGTDIGTSTAINVTTAGLIGFGGVPVAGKRLTAYGAPPYNRLVKTNATTGVWDFGAGEHFVSGDNAFAITDRTSGFAPRISCIGTSSANQVGDVVIGPAASDVLPAVVATTATGGFLRLTTCAGPPTGAAIDGSIVIDTTNNKCYIRSTGNWVALN